MHRRPYQILNLQGDKNYLDRDSFEFVPIEMIHPLTASRCHVWRPDVCISQAI